MDNNYENKKSMRDKLSEISKEISNLEKEKNLGQIVKQYNKINDDIKKTSSLIHELQNKIRSMDNGNPEENKNTEIMNDDQYEIYEKELSNEEVNKILNCEDLEIQIENYKKMLRKFNSCQNYLEGKKTIIIECDNTIEDKPQKIKNIKENKEIISKKTLKQKINLNDNNQKLKNNNKKKKKDSSSSSISSSSSTGSDTNS